MTITLVRGTETVEISADDELLRESAYYAGVFERKVTEVVTRFYQGPITPTEDRHE